MAKLPGWRGRGGPAPLGEFLAELVAPALARQGLGETSLITDWTEIVGAHIAKSCRPIEVQWPPRASHRNPDAPVGPATLILRVEGGFGPRDLFDCGPPTMAGFEAKAAFAF